jgi:hypothetical protein
LIKLNAFGIEPERLAQISLGQAIHKGLMNAASGGVPANYESGCRRGSRQVLPAGLILTHIFMVNSAFDVNASIIA